MPAAKSVVLSTIRRRTFVILFTVIITMPLVLVGRTNQTSHSHRTNSNDQCQQRPHEIANVTANAVRVAGVLSRR